MEPLPSLPVSGDQELGVPSDFASKCLSLRREIALSFSPSNARIDADIAQNSHTPVTLDLGIYGFRAAARSCTGFGDSAAALDRTNGKPRPIASAALLGAA
jgi:CMP-2-keto-3-deoxyoctulosonic acid synthetase